MTTHDKMSVTNATGIFFEPLSHTETKNNIHEIIEE